MIKSFLNESLLTRYCYRSVYFEFKAECMHAKIKLAKGYVILKALRFEDYFVLYNNQINARALIGLSAMFYGGSKLMEKSRVF